MANQTKESGIRLWLPRRRGWLLVALAITVVIIDLLIWRFTVYQNMQQREEARLELWQMNLPFTRETFFQKIREGDIYAVRVYLAAGMNPGEKNSAGDTPFMIAKKYHHPEIMKLLTEKR
ncbi:MAG: hypothetical protein PHW74_01595 [Desulfobacca sp.]|nr:hypothetical protein [Desulfobacca sp.]